VIESINFRGARRVPQDTLRVLVVTKKGDAYDDEQLRRDFMALWNTGKFDDIRIEREAGQAGWVVTFVLVERRIVRSIKYDGMKSITVSEILDRFKERKVGLSVESTYDPNKVQHAANVLRDYESERGHQFATVDPEIRQIPPSSLEITFKVNEGPKVQVGNIIFHGNQVFTHQEVLRAMKNLHPIGIPYSIFFENLFSRTYDSSKLEEDQERIQDFYQKHGYYMAKVTDHKVEVKDVGGSGFRLPLLLMRRPGKAADIDIWLEEGRLFHLHSINYVGVKAFRTPELIFKPVFRMGPGDVFSTENLKKGFDDLRKLYGQFGYINFVATPDIEPVAGTDQIDLTLNVDEGHMFFVRRIDFSGNTTTRDRVIRRELFIDEGDIFNSVLWERSILRLNQLGYFEPLKADESVTMTQDTKTNTVDLTLKLKERGRNSVQLSGGVSGIAGSFVQFSYSTNNLMGMGETLSLTSQLGTRLRSAQLGFSEPYFLNRPLAVGFTIYIQRFDYNQAREASILSGANLIGLYEGLGTQNLLNYISNSRGFTTYASYPWRRAFARVGLTYGYNIQNVNALTTAAQEYFQYINFLHINGPNSLTGITTSYLIPSYVYNTVNNPIDPSAGKSLSITAKVAGSVLGGNVNEIEPMIDAKYWHHGFGGKASRQTWGLHASGRMITGYGGKDAAPFDRFYMGGENDIRGFNIWGISPIAWIPNSGTVDVLNNDGSPRQQKEIVNGQVTYTNVTQTIPVYQLVTPGGDTSVVANAEYRIPIFGPVKLAPFFDAGVDKLAFYNQLKLNPGEVETLNAQFPEAAFPDRAVVAPGTQQLRASTGLELQIIMPVVNAPFRVYWAYNPLVVREYLQPPIVADRTYFPNQATFANAIATYGQAYPFFEGRSMFRFTIGRTF